MKKYNEIFVNDKLGIQSDVVDFAHLIEQETYEDDGIAKVYSISAEFGIGKTFFCYRLKEVLEVDEVPVTKMNIWEMDFYETPLIPILIKLQEAYKANNGIKEFPNPTKLLNLFKSIVAGITIEAKAPYIGKVVIDGEKIIKNHEQLNQKLQETDIYAEYKQYEKELKKLKDFLHEWAKDSEKPIVIIIDELDRCRPDYAVKTLEVLKHFFDIPGFVFVLALDEKQLENSVRCLFGTENFDGYKRKFINNSFILPAPNKVKFTDFLYEKSGIAKTIDQIQKNNIDLVFKIVPKDIATRNFSGDTSYQKEWKFNELQTSESIIKRYFAAYSIWFKFTLRQMEQVFDRLVLFARQISTSNEFFSPDLSVLLVCLHEFDINIYNRLRYHGSVIQMGVIKQILGIQNSLAILEYGDSKDTHEKFDKFDRELTPEAPQVEGYSTTYNNSNGSKIIIRDNVDRFFKVEFDQKHALTWIIEVDNCGAKNTLENNGRILYKVYSKGDGKFIDIPPDVNTAETFDLEKFRQSYFSKMDFISRFSPKDTSQTNNIDE
jgi:hypothetical protein